MIQTRSHKETSATILPKVHGGDKGVDPNIKAEKQIIEPLSTPIQSNDSTESKTYYHLKPGLGQGRASIKKKKLRFPMPRPYDKPKQPKFLPGKRPIIQIAERSILQPPKNCCST